MDMKNTSFYFLWAGQSLALFGDSLAVLALVSLVYGMTGTATETALVPICRVGALLLSGMIAPIVIERLRLARLLFIAQLAQAVLYFLLVTCCIFFLPYLTPLVIFSFVFLISFFEGWALPARNSLVPRLVAKEELVKANGYLATTDQSSQFLGWAAGGVLVAALGPDKVLAISLFLVTVSVISISFVLERKNAEPTEQANPRKEPDGGCCAKDGGCFGAFPPYAQSCCRRLPRDLPMGRGLERSCWFSSKNSCIAANSGGGSLTPAFWVDRLRAV
jgi:MFS-type transporter involved in bile tolerance (Atg22 family)